MERRGCNLSETVWMYIWLGATVLFGAIEAITVGLTSIWFAAGALLAMITAACGGSVWLQFAVFIVATALLLVCTRPLVKKILKPKEEKTNAAALVGQEAIVVETIDNDAAAGAVRVGGKVWTARSEDGDQIPADAKVIIARIGGVKLFVRNIIS